MDDKNFENVSNFTKEIESNEELRAKIEALEGADDAIEKVIAIAAEYGYSLTEGDFEKDGTAESSLGDLGEAAGGMKTRRS